VDRGKAVGDASLDLGKGAVAGKAGVVDEQVEPTLPGDPILDEEELLGIREVGDKEVDSDTGLGLQTGGQRLQSVLYACAEAVRLILLHLEPILPETVAQGFQQLGWSPAGPRSGSARWGVLPPGAVVRQGPGLFPRKD
jgi:hypothetical protein